MNTAEIITGEICGTFAFLGLTVGYTWLYLHYAKQGVLKFSRPPQTKAKAITEGQVPAAVPVKAA